MDKDAWLAGQEIDDDRDGLRDLRVYRRTLQRIQSYAKTDGVSVAKYVGQLVWRERARRKLSLCKGDYDQPDTIVVDPDQLDLF